MNYKNVKNVEDIEDFLIEFNVMTIKIFQNILEKGQVNCAEKFLSICEKYIADVDAVNKEINGECKQEHIDSFLNQTKLFLDTYNDLAKANDLLYISDEFKLIDKDEYNKSNNANEEEYLVIMKNAEIPLTFVIYLLEKVYIKFDKNLIKNIMSNLNQVELNGQDSVFTTTDIQKAKEVSNMINKIANDNGYNIDCTVVKKDQFTANKKNSKKIF